MTTTVVRPTPMMMPARRTVEVPATASKLPARPQQTSAPEPVQLSVASNQESPEQRPGESATRQFTPKRTKASRPVPMNSPRQRQLEERFENGGTLTAKELMFLLRVRPDLESKIQPKLVKAKVDEAKKRAANKAKRADANRTNGKAHMNGGKKKQ